MNNISPMDIEQAYNSWAGQYDTNVNKTRDLEAVALRETFGSRNFDKCLEIGCGTGKNTQWLSTKAKHVTAVDLSEEMLIKAKEKIHCENVQFLQFDIKKEFNFSELKFDMVVISLVLEHIENLNEILRKVSQVVVPNAMVYIGELHPFKQYSGTKARFETKEGRHTLTCYTHHVSDFTNSALQNGFEILSLNEYFDDFDKTNVPRILTLVFRKK
jgi:2-polyprenyl-3-methyl-5-hydroxy-6-metoxy-1,4-benzoquinol methylase